MYLNNWSSKIGMVSDFLGLYMSEEEFLSDTSPYSASDYWKEKKAQLQAALDSGVFDGNILLASYSYANYSGDAFVLLERDGKYFEVNGGHCSCYGLEGQWDPEETDLKVLRHRLEEGNLGCSYAENEFSAELKQVLDALGA